MPAENGRVDSDDDVTYCHRAKFSTAKWILEITIARRNNTHAFNVLTFTPSFAVEIAIPARRRTQGK